MPTGARRQQTSQDNRCESEHGTHVVRCDVLNTKQLRRYGNVTSISADGVKITQGCNSTDTITVAWDNIRSVTFTSDCKESTPPMSFGSGSDNACNVEFLDLFLIKFNSGGSNVLASSVGMGGDKIFQLKLYDSGTTVKGPAASVAGVKRLRMCSTSSMLKNMVNIASLPPDFKR